MKFTFRKLSALLLALMLVCGLCVNAFAAHEDCAIADDTVTLGIAIVDIEIHSCSDQVSGTVSISADPDNQIGTITCLADMNLSYIYCRDDIIKPSNYVYGSESIVDAYLHAGKPRYVLRSEKLKQTISFVENIMLESTLDCVVDVTTPNTTANHQFDDLTVYYY